MVGWQLCSNASYPSLAAGISLPPPGPAHLSLRLLKLDRGLHYYLLEAAYSLLAQVTLYDVKDIKSESRIVEFFLYIPYIYLCAIFSLSLTVAELPHLIFQRGTWLPREASIHLLLATPQSSIPRDMSLDLSFNPHRLLLRITHPLKTIHIQGRSQGSTKRPNHI